MSDHDAAPNPMDQAYVEAESVLNDQAARAARRARVLAAVAAQPQLAHATPSANRLFRRHGRWLAAASVAMFSLLVGLRFYQPNLGAPDTPAARPTGATAAAPTALSPEGPTADTATPTASAAAITAAPPSRQRGPAAPSTDKTPVARDIQTATAEASPPATSAKAQPAAPSPQATLAAPPATEVVEQVVVTGARRTEGATMAARTASKAADISALAVRGEVRAASLRAAAASGRIAELKAILTQKGAVDTPDDDGETALMKAVQANHADAAALLRRYGANPDLKNRAGQSARDMAASIADPSLNRALGVAP